MFLLIDKPKGITSHDVVDKIRAIVRPKESTSKKLRRIKVGHAGTLDPNATGLLIVGVGRDSTRKLWTLTQGMKKKYEAEIVLGEERDTGDVEGERIKIPQQVLVSQSSKSVRDDKVGMKSLPTLSNIESVLKEFIGTQMQVPPMFSAVKIGGKKAYELARRGKDVRLKPRKVTVYSIKLIDYKYPVLKIECQVSGGTYIRALARDIGRKLGTGAYLKNLRRISVGKFKIEEAVNLKELNEKNWKNYSFELN